MKKQIQGKYRKLKQQNRKGQNIGTIHAMIVVIILFLFVVIIGYFSPKPIPPSELKIEKVE